MKEKPRYFIILVKGLSTQIKNNIKLYHLTNIAINNLKGKNYSKIMENLDLI